MKRYFSLKLKILSFLIILPSLYRRSPIPAVTATTSTTTTDNSVLKFVDDPLCLLGKNPKNLCPKASRKGEMDKEDAGDVDKNYKFNHKCPQFSNEDVWSRVLLLPVDQDFGGQTVMGITYGILILYCFLGISIASHIFMLSIEVIVSKTRTVKSTKEEEGILVEERREVKVWNDTVANLTLMALGSSAPEILLSIIETVGNDFCPGALGPGTIVGSASYNLMIITAVCIVSVPSDTVKKIKEYKVFLTTSAFAMFAYIWLVIIIQVVSYNVVKAWEAIVTLIMFPILVAVAYWAEYDFCRNCKLKKRRVSIITNASEVSVPPGMSREDYMPLHLFYDENWDNMLDENGRLIPDKVEALYRALTHIAVLTDDEIAKILATKLIQTKGHSSLWFKIRAIEAFSAKHKNHPMLNDKLKEVMDVLNDMKRRETGKLGDLRPTQLDDPKKGKGKAIIQFTSTCMAVPIRKGVFTVTLKRGGKEDIPVFVNVESYDGTAHHGHNYEAVNKRLVFDPYVEEMKFQVHLIQSEVTNRDSNFFMKLHLPHENNINYVTIGPMSTMEIVLMDVQEPGDVQFTKKGQVASPNENVVVAEVERLNGAIGPLSVKWKAVPKEKCTAVGTGVEGVLRFEDGELKKDLEVPLVSGQRGPPQDEQFDLQLVQVVGGAGKIGPAGILTVAVSGDPTFKLQVVRLMEMIEEKVNIEESIPRQTYWEQIKSAFIVNGDKNEAMRATKADIVLHWVSLPWKAIFCLLPTPYFLGGFPCFIMSLAVIGLLTTLVGDMANILGWCCNMDPVTTGMTIVAMGTSLPDTFASRIAALNDKTADAAIGNITGSNCVNVFLGLGLSWTIAAIYTTVVYKEALKVESDSLAFIVTIYSFVAIIAQVILWLRRTTISFGAAELGGPSGTKWLTATFLVIGWIFYVIMSLLISQNTLRMGDVAKYVGSYLRIPNS